MADKELNAGAATFTPAAAQAAAPAPPTSKALPAKGSWASQVEDDAANANGGTANGGTANGGASAAVPVTTAEPVPPAAAAAGGADTTAADTAGSTGQSGASGGSATAPIDPNAIREPETGTEAVDREETPKPAAPGIDSDSDDDDDDDDAAGGGGGGAGDVAAAAQAAADQALAAGAAADAGAAAAAAADAAATEEVTAGLDALGVDDHDLAKFQQEGALVVHQCGKPKGAPYVAAKKWGELPLDPLVMEGITAKGWRHPAKIQGTAIPLILQNPVRNFIGQAATGKGKTGAFTVSMLSRLDPRARQANAPQAIIFCPTKIVMKSHLEVLQTLGGPKGITGRIVATDKKERTWDLQKGEDIMQDVVIASPAKVVNLMKAARRGKRPCIHLHNLRMMIVDEADEMIKKVKGQNRSFGEELGNVLSMVMKDCDKQRPPRPRPQWLLFSATYTKETRRYCEQFVERGPAGYVRDRVQGDRGNHNSITIERSFNMENFYLMLEPAATVGMTSDQRKDELIEQIYETVLVKGQTILFVNTKRRCEQLARLMKQQDLTVTMLHGGLSQSVQERNGKLFLDGDVKVLVATDYLKRGYDNPRVTLVVNVDLPKPMADRGRTMTDCAVDFVHRVGRAGRWDKRGMSVTFVEPNTADATILGQIEAEEFLDHEDRSKCHPFVQVQDIMIDLASRAAELGKQ